MTTSVEYKKLIEELTTKMREAEEAEKKEAEVGCNNLFESAKPAILAYNEMLPEGHKLHIIKAVFQDGTGKDFKIC